RFVTFPSITKVTLEQARLPFSSLRMGRSMRAMQANQSQLTRSTLDGTTGSGSFKPLAAVHPPRNSMPTQRPLGAAGRSADRRERSAPIVGRVRIGDALGLSSVWVQGTWCA